jgi:hypothetical protein
LDLSLGSLKRGAAELWSDCCHIETKTSFMVFNNFHPLSSAGWQNSSFQMKAEFVTFSGTIFRRQKPMTWATKRDPYKSMGPRTFYAKKFNNKVLTADWVWTQVFVSLFVCLSEMTNWEVCNKGLIICCP